MINHCKLAVHVLFVVGPICFIIFTKHTVSTVPCHQTPAGQSPGSISKNFKLGAVVGLSEVGRHLSLYKYAYYNPRSIPSTRPIIT
jgi:hypothetical protein